jgi:hypothetical protein
MSEARRQKAMAAEAAHLSAMGSYSPAIQTLAHLNLHDAHISEVRYNRAASILTARFRRGDLKIGYADTSITFRQIVIEPRSLKLLRDGVQASKTEVLAAELHPQRDGFRYRLLLWPKGEASLSFKDVRMHSTAVSGRGAEEGPSLIEAFLKCPYPFKIIRNKNDHTGNLRHISFD